MSSIVDTDSIDILLVGKTGAGKSETGNCILQRDSFVSSNNVNSETCKSSRDFSTYKNRVICVVDTPGLGDTRLNNKEDVNRAVEEMSETMVINPDGYHAILFVVKFGNRFTADDVNAIEILKKIFGKDFMRHHGILLFTCGDIFETDREVRNGKLTFDIWLAKQTEKHMQDVIKECGSRTILFNNRSEDENVKESQLDQLIAMIDGLTRDGKRYTNDNFQKAKRERDRLLKALNRPYLNDEHMKKISIITLKLGQIKIAPANINEALMSLQQLKNEADNILFRIQEEDHNTNALGVAIKVVKNVQISIQQRIDDVTIILDQAEEKDKAEKALEKVEAKFMRSQKQYLKKKKAEEEERIRFIEEERKRREEEERFRQREQEIKRQLEDERIRQKDEEARIANKKLEEQLLKIQKLKQLLSEKEAAERKQLELEKQNALEREEEEKRRAKKAEEDCRRQKQELSKFEEERIRRIYELEEQNRIRNEEMERNYQEMRKAQQENGVMGKAVRAITTLFKGLFVR